MRSGTGTGAAATIRSERAGFAAWLLLCQLRRALALVSSLGWAPANGRKRGSFDLLFVPSRPLRSRAYMMISVTMLGYGAAGTCVTLFQKRLVRRLEPAFALCAALFGVSST